MSELQPAAIEQSPGALERIAEVVDYTKSAGAVLLSGLSFGAAATAVESFVGESAAAAQTPSAATSRARQVEEYASVIAKTATGAPITGAPTKTFAFVEQCKDGSKKVDHRVIYDKKEQPLGDCNVGSKVTVTDEKPLSGNWQNKSAPKITLKATRNNNHRFVFIEQEQEEPTQPAPTITTPPPSIPALPGEPAPSSPVPPVTITPILPPPPTLPSRTIEVNETALNNSGATISTPTGTFEYVWTCDYVDEGIVAVNADPQVLGSCPEGQIVTITEETPLGTQQWTELSTNPQSFTVGSSTIEATFEDQEAASAPPPPPTSQSVEVNEVALNNSGETIPAPANTFQYDWTCNGTDEGTVTVKSDPQPFGSCPEGQIVTITEEAPLGTQQWTELTQSPQSFTVGSSTVEATFEDQEATAPPPPADPYTSGDVGVDISWPQCIGSEAPPSSNYTDDDFGIVGVNDGLDFSTNPCLEGEAQDFTSGELSLYANADWDIDSTHNTGTSPDTCAAGDDDCEAYDYGYNAGLYAWGAALSLGITSPTWWIEADNGNTWSTDTTQNQNSIEGEHDALIAEGATTVGIYSTTEQWDELTGSWDNGLPSWGATTWTTASEAATDCTGHEFTGGPSYLMQFTPTEQLDQDDAC